MRLALFTDTYLPQTNGVARTLHRLTGHLHRRGIEHLLFTPTSASEEECDDPVRKISSIPFFLYPECRLALTGISSIQQELRSFRPDLLHMATPFNLGLCGLRYAQKHSLPHIASYHTHFDRYLHYYRMRKLIPLYWKYMKWFHRTCDAVLVPSQETAGVLRAHGLSGLRQWSRGVDCVLYDPAKRSAEVRERYGIEAPLLLLYVGRVAPEKDLPTLMAAMRQLPESVAAAVHLLVVGDGPLLPELRADAPQSVSFAGSRHGGELAELYASGDLFVFPSSTETFGNVVLEAMASGLPVIAADAGGPSELVAPGRSGILLSPQQPEAMAEAICRLAEQPELRLAMGREGRRLALSRSWDEIFDQLIRDYEEVIEARRVKSGTGIFTA